MRVNGICIVTDDVARLRSFYTEALRAEAEGDDTFTAFHTDGAALSLFSTAGMEQMAPGSMAQAGVGRYTLEIEVDDLDAEFDRLNKLGCVVVKPPTTQPWGRRSVWVRDPDGNIVNFYANVLPVAN
jgi:catechol 2,3-dioxygenase-like lactoylglutathione lyase family enzyme